MTDPTGPSLHTLLEDAVSDVEPRLGLAEIQARTRTRHRRHGWVWGAVAGVAATAATVAAVAVVADRSPEQRTEAPPATSPTPTPGTPQPTTTPTQEASASPDPTAAPTAGGLLPVYFVGDTPAGPRLFREFLTDPTGAAQDNLTAGLLSALELSIRGEALDGDFRTGWPGGGSPDGFNVEGAGFGTGGATSDTQMISIALGSEADLGVRPQGMSADQAALALQQLVYTAQAVVGDRLPVQFTGTDGVPLERLLGIDVADGVKAADAMQVLAPVWIIDPQEGSTVGSAFVVKGIGTFFEATVSWQLLQGQHVVQKGFTNSREGMTRSEFEFGIKGVDPGEYTLRVYEADMSGGEGGGEPQDTKTVFVR
jgi:hypothetical protein